jgi:hypothetical protein
MDAFIESIATYDLRLIVFNPVQEVIVLRKP